MKQLPQEQDYHFSTLQRRRALREFVYHLFGYILENDIGQLLSFIAGISISDTIKMSDNRPVYMLESDDCGIATVATTTGETRERVVSIWPGSFKGNVSDSYVHHQLAIQRLGHRFDRRTIDDVIKGKCKPMRTALLLNESDDPETWVREDWFKLHWCVLAAVEETDVIVHWGYPDGNGSYTRKFNKAALRAHFINPFCVVYEVTLSSQQARLPWYKRLYARVTSVIGAITNRFFGGV